ncbi:alpha-hydroxy acid oxidase [Altericroceibacterium xinjiangense]|uniref:alpha-hydroxy acid oxidase n=1 Tax=Altericroceibacterium xinjiangense TaxID=762261 RepID=UPI000F7E44A8|nr:alpha-hydroxy acid oxidase [Altericroceibacterium xinjiangense]
MAGDFGCYNLADLRERARRRLPHGIWEYLERGVEDERGMAANRAAFDHIRFRPRVLRGVQSIDPGTSLFGRQTPLPLAIAPTGAAGLLWYQGDLALARAAAKADVPFTISSASTMDLEEIATSGARLWFQLYFWENRALSMTVVERAWQLGCEALLVTLDLPVPPNREYIQRNGFGTPFKLNRRNTAAVLRRPRWLAGVMGRYALTGGIPSQANLPRHLRTKVTKGAPPGALFKQDDLDWDGVAQLRDSWPGMLVLKGILRADDAERALALGIDGVVVSNHGGRALDGSIASIEALPAISSAVGDRMTVLLDSGIRRGSDIIKAVALGADAVLVGRAPLYGLAGGGEAGVSRAIDILRTETVRTMAMLGARNIGEVSPEILG